MKLYYSKGACSLAARITINELGIPCEFEAVNLKNKQTETGEDFIKINHKGYVPTLRLDNGEILTENIAIQQYLAEKNKANELLPPLNDFNRYRVIEWLSYISTELHKGCGPFFNSNIPEETKEKVFKLILKNKLNFVEQHLTKNKFLMGEQFTVADSYLWVILSWLPNFGFELSDWPNIDRYFKELKKRKSIQKSLKEEGI